MPHWNQKYSNPLYVQRRSNRIQRAIQRNNSQLLISLKEQARIKGISLNRALVLNSLKKSNQNQPKKKCNCGKKLF